MSLSRCSIANSTCDQDDEGFFQFLLGVLDRIDVGVAFVVDGVGEFGVDVGGIETSFEHRVSEFGDRPESPVVFEGFVVFVGDCAGVFDAEVDVVADHAGEGVGVALFPCVAAESAVSHGGGSVDTSWDEGVFSAVGVAEECAVGLSEAGVGLLEVRDELGAGVVVSDGEVSDKDDIGRVG